MKNSHTCCCEELGCASESFLLEGVLCKGKIRNQQNGGLHEAKLRRLRLAREPGDPSTQTREISTACASQSTVINSGRRRSLSTGDLGSMNVQSSFRGRNREASPIASDLPAMHRRRSSSQTIRGTNDQPTPDDQNIFVTMSTTPYKMPEVYLQRPSCLIGMLQVANGSILKGVKHRTSRTSLRMNKLQIEQTAKDINYTGRPYWENLPTSLPTLYTMLNLEVKLESQIVCPECFTLHGAPYEKIDNTYKMKCDAMRFLRQPDAKRGDPVKRHACGGNLYSGDDLKPCRQFHYHSLKLWLARMLSIPGFEAALDAPFQHHYDGSTMCDIWDGKMWRTFMHSGRPFTSKSGNLVFGLFVDWFNPHGRGARRAKSHGIVLLMCFNLPPDERYKQENLFLFGIIPGPNEPAREQMNELLKPLVAEFQDFWKGIFFTSTSAHSEGRVIRAALWPVIADLPAMRKVTGFGSHSATHFCAHCGITLSDRQIIDPDEWPERLDHQKYAEEWRDASTEKQQQEIFDAYGLRYTVLSELPYWRPIEFVTVDVMHCLLLGTLKDHALGFLALEEAGKKLKAKLDKEAHLNIRNPIVTQCSISKNSGTSNSNVSASETDSSEVQHQTSSNRNDSTESDSMDVDEASEKTESISMDWSRESDVDKSGNFTSPSSGHGLQSADKPRKRRRPRGVQVSNHKGKRAKTSTPLGNPDALATSWAPDLQLSNSLLSQNFSEFGSPSESIPVSSSEEPNSQRSNLRRSNRIQSQSVSRTVSSSVVGLLTNLETNESRGRDRSNTNTTVRGRATASKGKFKNLPQPKNNETVPETSNPSLKIDDLIDIRHAILTAKTPSWMSRPPLKIGIPKSGNPSAMEWLSFFTVYIVLVIIPKLYVSQDEKDQAVCQSLIYLVEITNSALSRTLSKEDKDELARSVHGYREHLAKFWKGISVKSNLHFLQHLVDITELFGPPSYTATMAGERAIGILVRILKNHHTADIDKTMTETYARRGIFKAVLKGCPTFLRRVDAKIRDEIIQNLTGTPTTKWSAERALDLEIYRAWLSYLNSELNNRYGQFSETSGVPSGSPILPGMVETTRILKVFGKNYTSYQFTKGRGNSAIEYLLQGKHCFGYIQYAFRTKLIPTVFLVVDQFSKLNETDSARDCFLSHPRLQAARVYSKIEHSVVVDVHDLMGHIIVLPHPPGHLGIGQETLGIVGLRNISSFNAVTTSE